MKVERGPEKKFVWSFFPKRRSVFAETRKPGQKNKEGVGRGKGECLGGRSQSVSGYSGGEADRPPESGGRFLQTVFSRRAGHHCSALVSQYRQR